MRIKTAMNYHLSDAKRSLIIFYGVVYVIAIGFWALSKVFSQADFNYGGMESASMIFLFVAGLNSFKGPFRMFLQNGISRKTQFAGYAASLAILAVGMAVVDNLSDLLFARTSMFFEMYGMRYVSSPIYLITYQAGTVQSFAEGLLWTIVQYFVLGMVGFFISALYYRMNKALKLLVSIGLPVLLFILLPIVDTNFTHGVIYDSLFRFIGFCMGYLNGFNPYYAVVSGIVLSLFLAGLSYLAIRRATVKE